jgi:hypothetical protein
MIAFEFTILNVKPFWILQGSPQGKCFDLSGPTAGRDESKIDTGRLFPLFCLALLLCFLLFGKLHRAENCTPGAYCSLPAR